MLTFTPLSVFVALLPLVTQPALTGQESRLPVKRITDVRQGMQKREVLAGLAEQYSLSKSAPQAIATGRILSVRAGAVDGLEAWLAYEKSTPEIIHSIWFLNETVSSVQIALAPVATSRDASRLVDGLFLALMANADPPASPSRVDMALGKESATATVEVEEFKGSEFSEKRIRLVLHGCVIVLTSTIMDGKPYLEVYRFASPQCPGRLVKD